MLIEGAYRKTPALTFGCGLIVMSVVINNIGVEFYGYFRKYCTTLIHSGIQLTAGFPYGVGLFNVYYIPRLPADLRSGCRDQWVLIV